MEKIAVTLQQLEEALRDVTRWIREKLAGYMQEPATEGKSGYVLTTNGAGGRSWEKAKTEDGVWRPSVSDEGVLSWARSAEENAPEAQNIRGPRGDKGDTGPVGPQGPPGEGVSKLVVNIVTENGEDFSADKSFEELVTALESGVEVEALLMGAAPMSFLLGSRDEGVVMFQMLNLSAGDKQTLQSINIMIYEDDYVAVEMAEAPIPAKTSDLENDSGFVDEATVSGMIAVSGGGGTSQLRVEISTEDGNTFTSNVAYADITAAIADGREVVASIMGMTVPFYTVIEESGTGIAIFNGLTMNPMADDATLTTILIGVVDTGDVMAMFNDFPLPTRLSQLENDAGFMDSHALYQTFVQYAAPQTLTDAQKKQARDNIGASEDGSVGAVRYDTAQSLTDAQKEQARYNIGVTEGGAVIPNGVVRYDVEQSLSSAETLQAKKNIRVYEVSAADYGAAGDGAADDTAAFQSAIAANRVVRVPGGTYNLSGEIAIQPNCSLVLAQDTVLNFAQTSGNCISMHAGASIVGNHGLIKVPYTFSGNVINIDTGLDTSEKDVPPYTNRGPEWKSARYIDDLHIVKLNADGLPLSDTGYSSGTAVNIRTSNPDDTEKFNYILNMELHKLRIAGAFRYGIYGESVQPPDDRNHQMHLSGVVDGARVGVYLKNQEYSYVSVMVQPRAAIQTNASGSRMLYAANGIVLENSRNVDLSGSRVMDWDDDHTMWDEGNEYQHLALLGDCSGAIINAYQYYAMADYDIRSLIYTDTPANLERITILQEPFTRWFKPREGVPYFFDGYTEKPLMLQEELQEFADTERTADFTNQIPTATGLDGAILNGTGYYKSGYRWISSGTMTPVAEYGCTGLIPAKAGDLIRARHLYLLPRDVKCTMVFFDENRSRVGYVANWENAAAGLIDEWIADLAESDEGFALKISDDGGDVQKTAYVAFSFLSYNIGERPVITVNEPITYSRNGILQPGIKVKAENVVGLEDLVAQLVQNMSGV